MLEGDIGHLTFHKHLDEHFFDCEPSSLANAALTWEGFLRCKQSNTGTPEIVLLGDSHAEHLFLGLAEAVPEKNVGFYIVGAAPYIENPEFKLIFDELISNGHRQHVLITMHYLRRVDAQGSGLYDGFASTIRALKDSGNLVTLVGDVPRFPKDPGFCAYYFAFPDKAHHYCALSSREVERQSMRYNGILMALADEFGLRYVRIDDALCSRDESCLIYKDEAILYRDSHHLNIIGSRLVGRYLANKLFPEILSPLPQ